MGEWIAAWGSGLQHWGVDCNMGEWIATWGSGLQHGGVDCNMGEWIVTWGSGLQHGGVDCNMGGVDCNIGGVDCNMGHRAYTHWHMTRAVATLHTPSTVCPYMALSLHRAVCWCMCAFGVLTHTRHLSYSPSW